jgi:preprotein translocase subunit SecD
MAVTSSLYNATMGDFLKGLNVEANTYTINLYGGGSFTFTASHSTKAAVDAANTQLTTGNGYTQDGKSLASVAVTVSGNDASFTADDVQWDASGGAIGPARGAVIFNSSRTDSPPIVAINFGEQKTADAGVPFKITWSADGIIKVDVP